MLQLQTMVYCKVVRKPFYSLRQIFLLQIVSCIITFGTGVFGLNIISEFYKLKQRLIFFQVNIMSACIAVCGVLQLPLELVVLWVTSML